MREEFCELQGENLLYLKISTGRSTDDREAAIKIKISTKHKTKIDKLAFCYDLVLLLFFLSLVYLDSSLNLAAMFAKKCVAHTHTHIVCLGT